MVNKVKLNDFFKNGYFVYKIENKKYLNALKEKIFICSKKILDKKINKNFFDNFHKLELSKDEENYFRMKLMRKINSNYYGAKIGYKIFKDVVEKIFGLDVVTQKNINLVIHTPGDNSQITVHRDAPPNSLYEIVVWLPVVNTYKTKNMRIVNKKNTEKIYLNLKRKTSHQGEHENLMNEYFKTSFKKSKSINLKFGEALIFWTPLIHCVGKNTEKETRWSLNFRYKNTFSPYGTKQFIDYFKVANSSTVTKLALEQQSRLIK